MIELTFTTPDLPRHLERAASTAAETGAVVGAGTVQTGGAGHAGVDAGAQFLVTPGQGPEAGRDRRGREVPPASPIVLGAFTPSEVMTALALGSDAVKIFPAHQLGPKYLKDLNGPFPGVPLIPSGGVNAANARRLPRRRRAGRQRRHRRRLPRRRSRRQLGVHHSEGQGLLRSY